MISEQNEYFKLAGTLPFFGAADLAPIGEKRAYLNIILSRYVKRGTMARLRKNLYVTKSYLDNAERKGIFSDYVEFTANKSVLAFVSQP